MQLVRLPDTATDANAYAATHGATDAAANAKAHAATHAATHAASAVDQRVKPPQVEYQLGQP